MTLATPMQATRSRELVAGAMAGFAAQDANPVYRESCKLAAVSAQPSTYGAGRPWSGLRPFRKTLGNPIVEPSPEWLAVIDAVCVRYRLHRRDVLGGWRSVEAVACRYEIWATLRAKFGTSYPKIGMMTGGFHHTAVMDGIARHEGRPTRGERRLYKKANSHLCQDSRKESP